MAQFSRTQPEKKELAVIYGFLVDVWAAQQNKNGVASNSLHPGKRSTRYKK